jgi:predicted ester cyclase
MRPEVMRDFAERYTQAWCSQDPTAVASFFSPQGSLTINDGAPAVGRDAIAQAAQSFMTAFPDLRVHFDKLVISDNHAEYCWTLTGTNNGPGGTGRAVRISGIETWRMGEDGKIAHSQGRFDAAEYQRQLRGAD